MNRRRLILATAVVLAAFVAGMAAMQAPLYARYSAEECLDAYRRADTRGDTARIDLHPYAASTGPRAGRRCGEVVARRVRTVADILSR